MADWNDQSFETKTYTEAFNSHLMQFTFSEMPRLPKCRFPLRNQK